MYPAVVLPTPLTFVLPLNFSSSLSSGVPSALSPQCTATSPIPLPPTPNPPPPNPPAVPPREEFDPHHTNWSKIDMYRFSAISSFLTTIECALLHPFYLLKTREQSDRSLQNTPWQQTKHQIRLIWRSNGVKGFYRAYWASTFTALPSYGIYMSAYTWTRDWMGFKMSSTSPSPLVDWMAPVVAGVVGDIACQAFYIPSEVISQQLQVANSPYRGLIDAVTNIWRSEGWRGFYQGTVATVVTSLASSAIWWPIYENCKKHIYRKYPQENESTQAPKSIEELIFGYNRVPHLIGGFVASEITTCLVNPFDVVKTRMQTEGAVASFHQIEEAKAKLLGQQMLAVPYDKSRMYKGFVDGMKRVYREEGLMGFSKGIVPKLASRGFTGALTSVFYESALFLSRKDVPLFQIPIFHKDVNDGGEFSKRRLKQRQRDKEKSKM